MSREEIHMGDNNSGGGASPLTARSIRLERVAQALAHSQEELRRFVFKTITYLSKTMEVAFYFNF